MTTKMFLVKSSVSLEDPVLLRAYSRRRLDFVADLQAAYTAAARLSGRSTSKLNVVSDVLPVMKEWGWKVRVVPFLTLEW